MLAAFFACVIQTNDFTYQFACIYLYRYQNCNITYGIVKIVRFWIRVLMEVKPVFSQFVRANRQYAVPTRY